MKAEWTNNDSLTISQTTKAINETEYIVHAPKHKATAIEEYTSFYGEPVVKLVRCKDCKHRPTGDATRHELEFPDWECPCQCEDYWYSWMPDDNWFCANGETE